MDVLQNLGLVDTSLKTTILILDNREILSGIAARDVYGRTLATHMPGDQRPNNRELFIVDPNLLGCSTFAKAQVPGDRGIPRVMAGGVECTASTRSWRVRQADQRSTGMLENP